MLYLEKTRQYLVYPSWLQFAYNWEILPDILSNPLKYDETSIMTYGIEGLYELGYPKQVQPADLLKGPLGGGIIVPHIGPEERWLPFHALGFNKGTTITTPRTLLHYQDLHFSIGFMEHCTHPGSAYQHPTKPKNYDVAISAEHVDSADDNVFWLVVSRQGRRVPEINELPKWVKSFGCILEEIPFESSVLARNTADWRNPEFDYSCFKIEGGGTGYGFHLAVMLYFGLHFVSLRRTHLRSIHLLSQIEGKPRLYSDGILKI